MGIGPSDRRRYGLHKQLVYELADEGPHVFDGL